MVNLEDIQADFEASLNAMSQDELVIQFFGKYYLNDKGAGFINTPVQIKTPTIQFKGQTLELSSETLFFDEDRDKFFGYNIKVVQPTVAV